MNSINIPNINKINILNINKFNIPNINKYNYKVINGSLVVERINPFVDESTLFRYNLLGSKLVEFIIDDVINKLYECKLNCYYCKEKIFLLYDIVREMKQWTLDRNNNDIGHNTNNVVISCLDCNLKRRRINMNSFLFTKQLNIIKTC